MQAYEWLSGTAGWNHRTDLLLTDSNSRIINTGWMDGCATAPFTT